MSPKGIVVLLVLGLCAVQMASAGHREERGIVDIIEAARDKLSSLISKAEDTARMSVDTVKKYASKVENDVLTSGTRLLAKAGFKLDLVLVSQLLKDNIKTCAKDENIKSDAKAVVSSVFSCVALPVTSLFGLVNEMKDLWKTAKNLPNAIGDVAEQCKAHASDSSETVVEDPLQLLEPVDSHDLAEVTNEVLKSASTRLSKRALWGLKRITRCISSVYTVAKRDLVSIPGDILSAATHAFQLVHSTQATGIPTCLGTKLAANAHVIGRLAINMGTCVASGVSVDDRLKTIVQDNPSLAGIEKMGDLAKYAASAAKAMNSVKTVTDMIG